MPTENILTVKLSRQSHPNVLLLKTSVFAQTPVQGVSFDDLSDSSLCGNNLD